MPRAPIFAPRARSTTAAFVRLRPRQGDIHLASVRGIDVPSLPTTMRAARYRTDGPLRGRLSIDEVPTPVPDEGEVLVRVAVSGVNPTDWKARSGSGMAASNSGVVTPNQDGAGVIAAVGDGVDADRVGERVWLFNAQWQRALGTAAEFIALPAEQAVRLPDRASLDLGAGLGIPALTAHWCLLGRGELAGRRVLVQGGAGAVGHAAIELARWAGARVAATVSSPEKAKLAAAADLVVDYRRDDVAARVGAWAPDGVDLVVEVDLARNLATDVALLAQGGTIASYAVTEAPVALPRGLMAANAGIRFVLAYTMPAHARAQAVADVTRALEDGALTPLPTHRFTLDETAAAHDAVRDGAVGKVLIDVGS
jgi:NADPH2:quinone reductase